jgi:uncharacterized protein YndB with AHSA1/START domain
VEVDTATVVLERMVNATPEAVWRTLTDPAELAQWLAPASIGPSLGGEVSIEFAADETVTGAVTTWDPPSRLAYTWGIAGEAMSHVTFELVGRDSKTLIRLTHERLPATMAAGYGAGWHAHGDQLVAVIGGTEISEWDVVFSAVLPHYSDAT